MPFVFMLRSNDFVYASLEPIFPGLLRSLTLVNYNLSCDQIQGQNPSPRPCRDKSEHLHSEQALLIQFISSCFQRDYFSQELFNRHSLHDFISTVLTVLCIGDTL